MAESFDGLTVNDPGRSGFEFFSGSPHDPLALDVGAAANGIDNIASLASFTGIAGDGGGEFGDIAEGVAAVLFDFDILELGLNVSGANPISQHKADKESQAVVQTSNDPAVSNRLSNLD